MKRGARRFLCVVCVLLLAVVIAMPTVVPMVIGDVASAKLAELGYPSDVSMVLGYCWRNGPGIRGELHAAVHGSAWRATVSFAASACEWEARVSVPKIDFSESEPLVSRLLEKYPVNSVSNLTFSGAIALDAKAVRTFSMPVPVWSVKVPVSNVVASLVKEGRPLSVNGLTTVSGASGIASHCDISPAFLRAKSFSAAEFTFTNCYAAVRATEKALLVTEAGADFGGGKLNLYSVFVNPKNLNMGFTLFLNEIDAGAVLSHLKGFRGEASGKLHGKVRLFVKEGGKLLRLSDAFLYSTPGEIGKLQMANADTITDNLEMMGVDSAARDNVAKAMANLDYSVLRFDLRRKGGDMATLGVQIKGMATRGGITVPVDVNININGELEQILNRSIGISKQLKEKKP